MIVVGHRGWPQAYPENTLASFKAALSLGVDAIELDVRLTKDGRLAVLHDADTERITGVKGIVGAMTLDELKRFDAGWKSGEAFAGERIPSLEEVMGLVAGKAALYIEVKPPGEGGPGPVAEALAPLLADYPGAVVVHSFDAGFLREFRKVSSGADTGFLCSASPETLAQAVALGCTAIHPEWHSVTREMNAAIRKAGLRMMVWTARTEEDCRAILDSIDTDAIAADCPDALLRLLRERGER